MNIKIPELALKIHPDKIQGELEKIKAEEKMSEINIARDLQICY